MFSIENLLLSIIEDDNYSSKGGQSKYKKLNSKVGVFCLKKSNVKKIRQDKDSIDIPLLVLSNLSSKSKMIEAFKEGVNEYLIKSEFEAV